LASGSVVVTGNQQYVLVSPGINANEFRFVMIEYDVYVKAGFLPDVLPDIASSLPIDNFDWSKDLTTGQPKQFPMYPMAGNPPAGNAGEWWGNDGENGPNGGPIDFDRNLPVGPRSGYWIMNVDGQITTTAPHSAPHCAILYNAINGAMVGRDFRNDVRNHPTGPEYTVTEHPESGKTGYVMDISGYDAVTVWVKKAGIAAGTLYRLTINTLSGTGLSIDVILTKVNEWERFDVPIPADWDVQHVTGYNFWVNNAPDTVAPYIDDICAVKYVK